MAPKPKTFKELMRILNRDNDPFRGFPSNSIRGVYKVPIKHIRTSDNSFIHPNKKVVAKYLRYLKRGKAKTSPPINVIPASASAYDTRKKFVVIDGHHRLKAHKLAGRKTISVRVKMGRYKNFFPLK